MKKKLLIGIAIILFIILIIVMIGMIVVAKKHKALTNVIATINYGCSSLMSDSGSNYKCFFEDKGNYYEYEIQLSQITIAGAGKWKNIKNGIIRSKSDLLKLYEKMQKDISGEMDVNSYINFEYMNESFDTFDEFANKLFEK